MTTKPTLLDGLVTPTGQGQEGMREYHNRLLAEGRIEELHEEYRRLENAEVARQLQYIKDHDFKFTIAKEGCRLDDNDYWILWHGDEAPNYYDTASKIKWQEDYFDILDKVDLERTSQAIERALIKAREESKRNKHAGYELGAREFTLTYSPKWFDDNEAREQMKKAIAKLIKYYKDDIVQLRAVGEVGSNGLSHVHCFYKLRGGLKITDKNFKRAYKYWNPKRVTSRTGHEGGHHANVRHESDFQGYIDKDVDTAWFDMYYPTQDPTV